jgi:hypothetical protein
MSRFYRWFIKTARTLHLYVTLFGLTLILFFAVTGFMLNHIEWFVDETRPPRVEPPRPLPTEKLGGGVLEPDEETGEATAGVKLAVVEALRKEFDIAGELTSFQFVTDRFASDSEDDEERELVKVEFKRAGEVTEAAIDRKSLLTEVSHRYKGVAGVMTDLHRGNRGNVSGEVKFTGTVWSVVIDATCVLMLVISGTGLVLWWSLKGRGKWGPVVLLLGTAVAFGAYYWYVP